ncbi:hypothetical protein J4226_00600 [Candidatus Pacearchaeota archaeon]|nr:hypothetical protein [Candidatus Pacearchaeota archaeon]
MKTKILPIFLIAFATNAIWELLHYPLYIDLSGIPQYPHLFLATITDAIIITTIFLIISLKNSSSNWTKNPKKTDYLIALILPIAIAIAIETRALKIQRWAYTSSMPTILGIGLSPLIQLATTSIITFAIIKKIKST